MKFYYRVKEPDFVNSTVLVSETEDFAVIIKLIIPNFKNTEGHNLKALSTVLNHKYNIASCELEHVPNE